LYLTAIFSGEVQAANALIHPDSDISEYTEDAAERNPTLKLTIQSIEIADKSENTATVNAVVTITNMGTGEVMNLGPGEEVTRSQIYTLQTDDDTWKIYDTEEDEAA
jgi:hypothetical protein